MQGNSDSSSEVHSASSVLNLSRHNGCDRYIAEGLLEPEKVLSVRKVRSRVVPRFYNRPCISGAILFFIFHGLSVRDYN